MDRGIPVFKFPAETIAALDKVVGYELRHKHVKPIAIVKEETVKARKINKSKTRKKRK